MGEVLWKAKRARGRYHYLPLVFLGLCWLLIEIQPPDPATARQCKPRKVGPEIWTKSLMAQLSLLWLFKYLIGLYLFVHLTKQRKHKLWDIGRACEVPGVGTGALLVTTSLLLEEFCSGFEIQTKDLTISNSLL